MRASIRRPNERSVGDVLPVQNFEVCFVGCGFGAMHRFDAIVSSTLCFASSVDSV